MDKRFRVTAFVRVMSGCQFAVATGYFMTAGVSPEFERAQCNGLFIYTGKALPEIIEYFFHICLGGVLL